MILSGAGRVRTLARDERERGGVPKSYVSDLRDFLDEDGQLAAATRTGASFGRFLGALVAWATMPGVCDALETNVVCGWRTGVGRCDEPIAAALDLDTATIRWECACCGTNGWIHGWEGTAWDRRTESEQAAAREAWHGFERDLAHVRATGSGELATTVARFALPGVRLDASASVDASIPIGASKLGGAPDLPSDVGWPERDGRALAFVAQLDLAQLGEAGGDALPLGEGVLWIFCDADDLPMGYESHAHHGIAVVYRRDCHALVTRRSHPNAPSYTAYQLDARRGATFPSPIHHESTVTEPSGRPARELRNPFTGALMSFPAREPLPGYRTEADPIPPPHREEFEKFVAEHTGADRPQHQLFGHPRSMQGTGFEATLAVAGVAFGLPGDQWTLRGFEEAADRGRRWRLLAQIASQPQRDRRGQRTPSLEPDRRELVWADGGVLYLFIRDEDLSERRFDRIWPTVDCC